MMRHYFSPHISAPKRPDIGWMLETEALALQILIFLAVLQLKTLLVGQAAPWYGVVTSNAPY